MINRERLYSIPGITAAGTLDRMSDKQLELYLNSMNSFIDRFPVQSHKLQEAVDGEAPATVITGIITPICDTLTRLHAGDIVKEYRPKIDKILAVAEPDYDALEAVVENFILTVSSLSIELQMATHKGAQNAPVSASRQQPQPSQPAQAKQIYSRDTRKILAVDNAVMYLNTLKKLLENSPYELYCTTSCAEAIQYAASNRIDLALLDIEMPEMDGYELARRLKQNGFRAPIVFVTANSAREYIDKAIEVGAEGLLMKPLRINQLQAKLQEFI